MRKIKPTSGYNKKKASTSSRFEFPKDGVRLNKYVAHCGIASRRKSSEYIMAGQVMVNDERVESPGHRVHEEDIVKYKGEVIKPVEEHVYILLNKPKGFITTARDERNRRTVFDLLGEELDVRVYPVGRLDRQTTGLLLLTNDGDLTKKLTHPSFEVSKIYHVMLDKDFTEDDLERAKAGLVLEDGPIELDGLDFVQGKSKKELGIELHSGRNRIVRRIFAHLGYEVIRLDRTYFAGLTKKDIPRGRYRYLKEEEVRMLKHFV